MKIMEREKLEQFKQYLMFNNIKTDNYLSTIKTIDKLLKGKFIQDKITELFMNFNKSEETYNMYLKTLRKWNDCFSLNLKLPKYRKIDKKLPVYLELEYLENEIIPRLPIIFGKKMASKVRAVLLFMFYTGVRKSELIELKRNNIFLLKRKAFIHEIKKKRERTVFFSEKVVEALIEYFEQEEEKINAFNITKERLAYIFRMLKQNFPEVKEALHPHSFRHSFAVHCLKNNIPLSVLKEMLGHNTIQTTLKYTEVDSRMLEDFYRKHIK